MHGWAGHMRTSSVGRGLSPSGWRDASSESCAGPCFLVGKCGGFDREKHEQARVHILQAQRGVGAFFMYYKALECC